MASYWQARNRARYFAEFDEFGIDPASNSGDILMLLVVTDLEQMRVLDAGSEYIRLEWWWRRVNIWFPGDTNQFLWMKQTFTWLCSFACWRRLVVTEFPTNGAALQVEDVQRQFFRLPHRMDCWKIETKQGDLFNWLPTPRCTERENRLNSSKERVWPMFEKSVNQYIM